jgi:predicted NBD/HSP70 family sugar kinase
MYIGVDIGASKTLVASFSKDGQKLGQTKFATDKTYQKFLPDLIEAIKKLASNNPLLSIVVATQGTYDYQKEIITRCGNLEWKNIPLKTDLMTAFNVLVTVDNDCNVAALGEAIAGSGKNYPSVLYITLSTGIGGGLVKDKKLVNGMKKTEPGFMIFPFEGELVEWEEFASGDAFLKHYGVRADEVKDPSTWKDYAQRLTLGFAALISVIQPDVIVVGGSMGAHLEEYKPHLLGELENIRSQMWDIPPIVMASDPDNAVINGCYLLAKHTEL